MAFQQGPLARSTFPSPQAATRPLTRGGTQQGPTPWWQTSKGAGDRLGNLERSTPSGYDYDPVQMGYVRKTTSAPTEERLMQRDLDYEDTRRQQQRDLYAGLQGKLSGAIGGLQSAAGYGQTSPLSTGTTAPVSYPKVSMGGIPDASAAQSAAFGAAKGRAGAMGRSAVDSLRSELAERGIMGGGTEARGLTDILASATNPLSDVNVAQQAESLQDVRRTQDIAAQQAAQQYQGGITQRGQDIQQQQFAAQQAQQRQLAQLQLLQNALSGLSRLY